ncbi:MAG: VWA domain-containing protein, partial [Planctomycetota bacterium]|nr:VWA domain-containing protein [Planctomycetota bacterium]
DPLVLTELIRIRVRKRDANVMDLLKERLNDPHWTVRAAIIRELSNHRKKEVVDLLVGRMQKEDGRLLDDIADALTKITGKRFVPEPDPWRIWWEKARATWIPPQEATAGDAPGEGQKAGVVYFYGIQTRSKRVVFCIDISGSMEFPLDGRNGKKDPRIKKAKAELTRALSGLPDDAMFSIVVYNAEVKTWKKRMQPANQKNKMAARKFVEKLGPSGATNIFDALLTSMEIAATVGKSKGDPQVDTIFFLTDGIPSHGKIVDPHQILAEVRRRNELLGLAIHCVGVSKDQNRSFLFNLAKQNSGKYVSHTK